MILLMSLMPFTCSQLTRQGRERGEGVGCAAGSTGGDGFSFFLLSVLTCSFTTSAGRPALLGATLVLGSVNQRTTRHLSLWLFPSPLDATERVGGKGLRRGAKRGRHSGVGQPSRLAARGPGNLVGAPAPRRDCVL